MGIVARAGFSLKRKVSRPRKEDTECRSPLTPEEAKQQVFDHWHQLEGLARRRFPRSEPLADEALTSVLEKLQANNWQRVCTWSRLGPFLPFLVTLASRLMTDFAREKFGYVRPPTWLAAKVDTLWETAYRLIIMEKYERHEALELLQVHYPEREHWFIADVVATVARRCRVQLRNEETVPIEEVRTQLTAGPGPAEELSAEQKELLETLEDYLHGGESSSPALTERVRELGERLRPYLRLTEEDRLFLRLRHIDGLTMANIVNILHLKGDPYKRYHKLIAHIRRACEAIGLVPEG